MSNFLIISKDTNWEIHLKNKSIKLFNEKYIYELKDDHRKHENTILFIEKFLNQKKIYYDHVKRDNINYNLDNYDIILTVGGDGTTLLASHYILSDDTYILGIKSSVSSVGFLCNANFNNIENYLKSISKNKFKLDKRARLIAQISKDDKTVFDSPPVLNDFLYSNIYPASTTRYTININDIQEIQKSSGIWLSTPTGSSAAIKAAGGSVLDKNSYMFQYLVRELYFLKKRKSKLVNGYFTPLKDKFKIKNQSLKAILALDGQHGKIDLNYGDLIEFKKAPHINMIESLDFNC